MRRKNEKSTFSTYRDDVVRPHLPLENTALSQLFPFGHMLYFSAVTSALQKQELKCPILAHLYKVLSHYQNPS